MKTSCKEPVEKGIFLTIRVRQSGIVLAMYST